MTNEQLKAYELELYEIKAKFIDIKLKGSLLNKSDVSNMMKYAKRIKQIQKILKKAKRESDKRDNTIIFDSN